MHAIYLDEDAGSDRSASFFGLVDTQLSQVCAQLQAVPELAHGFNAIGFSQGGQFLRGYVERCNDPPLKTLITFGAQHNGIADFLGSCKPTDFLCKSASSLLRSSKWAPWVQRKVVPAQYYRDPDDLESYLEHSAFLADINNERPGGRNETYKKNLASLERFVMVMFEDDETVVPKESAWFAEFNSTSGVTTPLEQRAIYKEDWLGLKKLGHEGKLEYLTTPGKHMALSDKLLVEMFKTYLGPGGKKEEKKKPKKGKKSDGKFSLQSVEGEL